MPLLKIDDPGDERIAAYRNIRERDLVGREHRFIAEGRVVLNVLLGSPHFPIESALVLRNRLPQLDELLEKRPDVPVYVADSEVMERIAGFSVHRGILAIGRKGPANAAEALIPPPEQRTLIVVCVGISNHDNIGSIFRNAAAFGANAILLDQTCCDPLYRKAIRVSVGAALKVPFAHFDRADRLFEQLNRAGIEQFALSPRGNTEIGSLKPARRVALYLGAEGAGLPDDILNRIEPVRIPIKADFDSLNVAAATAIALHHFSQL